MAEIDVYDQKKKKSASMTLSAGWDEKVRRGSIYETVLWHLNERRAGTASTKSRSEVRGSGRKIYRQKGTGNARHSDRQAPIFVGGGIAGGPKPRSWGYALPKKERQVAIRSLLIDKLHNDKIRVLEGLDFTEIKTKLAKDFFGDWQIESALVVLDKPNEKVVKSIRNLNRFKVCGVESLNVADLMSYDYLIVTKPAMEVIERQWVRKT